MATEKKTTTVSPSSVKEPSVAVKAEPKKAVAEKAEPKKAAPKKAAAKKPAAKKAAPKKATAVKATAKKVAETLLIQAAGNEWDVDGVREQVIAAYVADGPQRSGISSLTVYIKPEERKAYYVINGKTSGSADI